MDIKIFIKKLIFIIMKIIVTENQFGKIMEIEDVPSESLLEQVAMASEGNAITIVQQKINDILNNPKTEKSMLDGTSMWVHKTKTGLVLQIGEIKIPLETFAQGVYGKVLPPGKRFAFGTIPMSNFSAEIEKIPEYKALVEKHPEIKGQLQKGSVAIDLHSDRTQTSFFEIRFKTADRVEPKTRKMAVPIDQPYPLGEFFARGKVYFITPQGWIAELSAQHLTTDLRIDKLNISPAQQRQAQPAVAATPIQAMGLADVFEYDSADFKDEARVDQEIQGFIHQIKGYIEKYGGGFIEPFKQQDLTIYGYSSRDGDPNQEITGAYTPCSGNKIRKEYNVCLSGQRAKMIAEKLNKGLPELDGAFGAKGMGETDQFGGPGSAWTAEKPTHREQTAPNRRYVLKPMKPIQIRSN